MSEARGDCVFFSFLFLQIRKIPAAAELVRCGFPLTMGLGFF